MVLVVLVALATQAGALAVVAVVVTTAQSVEQARPQRAALAARAAELLVAQVVTVAHLPFKPQLARRERAAVVAVELGTLAKAGTVDPVEMAIFGLPQLQHHKLLQFQMRPPPSARSQLPLNKERLLFFQQLERSPRG